jgi:hypothetical protein
MIYFYWGVKISGFGLMTIEKRQDVEWVTLIHTKTHILTFSHRESAQMPCL